MICPPDDDGFSQSPSASSPPSRAGVAAKTGHLFAVLQHWSPSTEYSHEDDNKPGKVCSCDRRSASLCLDAFVLTPLPTRGIFAPLDPNLLHTAQQRVLDHPTPFQYTSANIGPRDLPMDRDRNKSPAYKKQTA